MMCYQYFSLSKSAAKSRVNKSCAHLPSLTCDPMSEQSRVTVIEKKGQDVTDKDSYSAEGFYSKFVGLMYESCLPKFS